MNGHYGTPWFAFRSFRYAPDEGGSGAPVVAAEPVATEQPAPSERPRDESGRFTKAKIEAAAGFTPEPQAAAPVAVAASPETSQEVPSTPDADLDALQAYMKQTAGPAVDAPTVPATPEAAAAPAVPPQPQTPQIPQEVLGYAQMAHRIEQAASSGDAAQVLNMFDPKVVEAIKDHIYRQNADAFAQRYAEEAQGIRQDPRVEQLQRQLAELAQGIQQRTQNEEQQRTQAEQARINQQVGTKVRSHIDGLFNTVKLSDSPHRPWIESRLRDELGKVQNASQNIYAGRYGDINRVFNDLYVQFRPLLQASASPAQAAPKPSGAATLMATPSGTTTTQTADASDAKNYNDTSGRMPVEWVKAKLKKFVS